MKTISLKKQPRKINLKRRKALNFYLFLSPWLIGFLLFTIIPMSASLFFSFRRVSFIDLNTAGVFIGFGNYMAILKDDLFISSIANTFKYALLKTFIGLTIALLLASLLNRKTFGNKFVRTLIYLPAIIPTVASVMIWSQLYSNDFSLFNYLLSFFNIPPINWFSYDMSLYSVLLMGIWTSLGPSMIIILAALQNVPEDIIEAATIDGANRFQRFIHITIPTIAPTLFFLSITGIIGGLQAYAEMQLLFSTGTDKTMTMAWNVVLNAFNLDGSKTMGYASAQAWVLFIIIICFTFVYFKLSNKLNYGEGFKK